jgi:ATP-dependent Clp protease ATP-binding subunit ClpB
MDDGRLTDGQGRTVDFTNVVLIMTSNLQGDPLTVFRPEFVNRVDDIVIFHRLTQDHLRQIVDIQVAGLERRLAERRISIDLTDKAREYLAERGFDPAYGARPLKRLMQREISDALALLLLQGEFAEGDRIEIDAGEAGLVFHRA